MEEKFKSICEFYALAHKLKNLVRSGWKQWHINSDRLESVAEHIYGTQMLAFAVNSQFNLGLDIEKIVYMLAFHELGEIVVGDLTILDHVSKAEKHRREAEAVAKILEPMMDKERIFEVFNEFEAKETKEAIFAGMVDHFECNLQVKYYDEMNLSNIKTHNLGEEAKQILQDPEFSECKSLSELWIKYHRNHDNYDELFQAFSDYLAKHDVFK